MGGAGLYHKANTRSSRSAHNTKKRGLAKMVLKGGGFLCVQSGPSDLRVLIVGGAFGQCVVMLTDDEQSVPLIFGQRGGAFANVLVTK